MKARVTCCATSARRSAPFNAFLFLQGIETLPLRMRAAQPQRAGGRRFLAKRPEVTQGHPPLVQTGAARERPTNISGRLGGLVGFELAGGARPAGGSSTR
jgi:O-acetylhomoserine (thiol)-lyase